MNRWGDIFLRGSLINTIKIAKNKSANSRGGSGKKRKKYVKRDQRNLEDGVDR